MRNGPTMPAYVHSRGIFEVPFARTFALIFFVVVVKDPIESRET